MFISEIKTGDESVLIKVFSDTRVIGSARMGL